MVINPFIITGKIEPKYFCDRIKESAELINLIENQNNVVLISPRRMGKTGLIKFCFDKKEVKDNYLTFFVDILQTTSFREFIFLLGKEIYELLLPRSRKIAEKFILLLKSLNGKLTYDPVSNAPAFNFSMGEIKNPEYTLKEIFEFLEKTGKRCILAIDEFQQITKYPEKNVEAILRTHIQNSSNCNFIFAGSSRHILQNMFLDSARPFYHSSTFMELNAIPYDIYADFACKMFRINEKEISKENVRIVYDEFQGHTYYLQRILNRAFSLTEKGETCHFDKIKDSVKYVINVNSVQYRESLAEISESNKEVLIAIAKEGEVSHPTSAEFLGRHALKSASSVQGALRKLLNMDLLTKTENKYSVTDKFLALWINQTYSINSSPLLQP